MQKFTDHTPIPAPAADPVWVVSVHTCGGSMGEAVPSLLTLGPYDESTAKAVEAEFRARLNVAALPHGYDSSDLWAIAEPVTPVPATTPSAVVDAMWGNEFIRDYLTDEDATDAA